MNTSTKPVELSDLLEHQPLLLFDGECGFCNRSVLFFLKRERKPGKVHFVSLQSDAGKLLLKEFKIDPSIDSMILIRGHDAFIKTCAVLRLTWYLRGLWPLLSVFLIVPPFLRNPFYDIVARNRQRFFGRVGHCELLKQEDQKRFLSQ